MSANIITPVDKIIILHLLLPLKSLKNINVSNNAIVGRIIINCTLVIIAKYEEDSKKNKFLYVNPLIIIFKQQYRKTVNNKLPRESLVTPILEKINIGWKPANIVNDIAIKRLFEKINLPILYINIKFTQNKRSDQNLTKYILVNRSN